jgi:glycosyltransferase involved in cell wall biosynthesis
VLSVVVPIGKMDGNIDKLSNWIEKIDPNLVEIILIHDKQDETTAQALETMRAKLPTHNTIMVEGRWGNPGAARNEGLAIATQEWIAFWDADDMPDFENVLNSLKNQDAKTEIVIGQFVVVDMFHGGASSSQSKTACLNDLILNPGMWRMIFRREVVSSLKFLPISMAEDQLFLISNELATRNIVYTSSLFYTYYQGQINQLTQNPSKILDLHVSLEVLSKFFSSVEGLNLRFARLLYLRQFSTLLKRSSLKSLGVMSTKFLKEYLGDFPFKPWLKFLDVFVFLRILLKAKFQ